MFEVVILVCTIANPFKCDERRVTPDFAEDMPFVCASRALQEAAKWVDANPGYVVKRFGCARRNVAAK